MKILEIMKKMKKKLDEWWEKDRNVMIVLMFLPLILILLGTLFVSVYSAASPIYFLGLVLMISGYSSLGLTVLLGTYLGLSKLVFAPWWSRSEKSKIIKWAKEVRKTSEILEEERARYSCIAAREFMAEIQEKIRREKGQY